MQRIHELVRDEEGQDVVEYGLLIATIAVVVLLAASNFGDTLNTWFGTLATRVTPPLS